MDFFFILNGSGMLWESVCGMCGGSDPAGPFGTIPQAPATHVCGPLNLRAIDESAGLKAVAQAVGIPEELLP